jgi:hypothetical protein
LIGELRLDEIDKPGQLYLSVDDYFFQYADALDLDSNPSALIAINSIYGPAERHHNLPELVHTTAAIVPQCRFP